MVALACVITRLQPISPTRHAFVSLANSLLFGRKNRKLRSRSVLSVEHTKAKGDTHARRLVSRNFMPQHRQNIFPAMLLCYADAERPSDPVGEFIVDA